MMARPQLTTIVITALQHNFQPFKEVMIGADKFGRIGTYFNTNLAFPGHLLFPITNLKKIANQFVFLKNIPINLVVSFIFNKKNTRPVFAKSSGASAFKRKIEKKSKLLCVSLPSTKEIFLPNNTLCVTGSSYNFYLNSITQGKWGFSTKPHKLVSVRGVAKNPVDHPNGGRTKAKQPELSPWG